MSLKEGQKVRVISDSSGHCIPLGEIITVNEIWIEEDGYVSTFISHDSSVNDFRALSEKEVEPVEEFSFEKTWVEVKPSTTGLKNRVEIKDDIALIYINRAGVEQIAIVDAEDLPYIESRVQNRLNIDSGGYVQHRKKVNGEYEVFQLHRELYNAFDWETVGFKNGNKLDLRKENLVGALERPFI